MFVAVTLAGNAAADDSSLSASTHFAAGKLEIDIASARMTVIRMVTPELE